MKLREHGIEPPTWSAFMLQDGRFEIGNWFYLHKTESAKANYWSGNTCLPNRIVLPFARDGESDDIACCLLSDNRSNVVIAIIHEDAMPVSEVEERFEAWVFAFDTNKAAFIDCRPIFYSALPAKRAYDLRHRGSQTLQDTVHLITWTWWPVLQAGSSRAEFNGRAEQRRPKIP